MERKIINLNGTWDFSPLYDVVGDISLPEISSYEKITVPSTWKSDLFDYNGFNPFDVMEYPKEWNKADTGVLHRKFVLDNIEGRAVYLDLEAVSQRSGIYINGKFIYEWDEIFLPLNIDITPYVNAGENDLTVVCTSLEKCTIASGEVKSIGLVGSGFGPIARGIWDNAFIETANKINIRDITIRTSFREKTIEVITELSEEAEGLTVEADVYDGDDIAFSLIGEPGSIKETWENPVLWDTDNPHLYTLKVRLLKDGEVIDETSERFGFREFWTEGPRFYLNGVPVNIRGDSWHFKGTIQMTKEYALNWYRMCKKNGVNYIRLHANPHPRYYLDAADEIGIFIVDETAIYGSGKSMDASNPVYIERCQKHCLRLIKRDKNHPSIIFWSLQNEMRWVDGRDVYKKYIPGMFKSMNELDPTRLVSIDGDNRLISYENTQIESLHYNIDGTIEQWRREKPLTIGEHGGMWYICPQNASQYVGYSAYDDFEPCAIGFAKKERLFLEYARRLGVPGISTFNFAYYFTYAMPDHDNYPEDAPFKKIQKYALTINNGYMEGYPMYRENPLMPFMRAAFRPVTAINREYDRVFYGDRMIERTFDVYNDTLSSHKCHIIYTIRMGEEKITGEEDYTAEPAESHILKIDINPVGIKEKTECVLKIKIYHDDEFVRDVEYKYDIYPECIKDDTVETDRKCFYLGNERGFERISRMLPGLKKIDDLSDAEDGSLLIIGDHTDLLPNEKASEIGRFAEKGGSVVILEQSIFALGNLCLQRQDFFSAYTGHHDHPILKGITDEDMIFWGPTVREDRAEPLIHSNFIKPQSGEYTFVLESAAGDYADGGDLWTPLMTMKHGKGNIVFSQIEIGEYYEKMPIAAVLLHNILDYASNVKENEYRTVSGIGDAACALMKSCLIKESGLGYDADIIIADITEADAQALRARAESGASVLVLPFDESGAELASALTGKKISVQECEISHLKPADDHYLTKGISPFDLYRYDKVAMSPRLVKNKRIAFRCIKSKELTPVLKDVPGTPWEDYYWHGNNNEMCIIPAVSMNREHVKEKDTFLAQTDVGNGSFILSQLKFELDDEKDIRVYSEIIKNMGGEIGTVLFDYERGYAEYAVDNFMTLPITPWQSYDEAKVYYTDPRFSLNNLGEGLYGWMKKLEKSRKDGFIYVPDSSEKKYFLTNFAYMSEAKDVNIRLDCNYPATLYVNGTPAGEKVHLEKGDNRIVVEAASLKDELRFRLVFLDDSGRPPEGLRMHLTIDEVDPK